MKNNKKNTKRPWLKPWKPGESGNPKGRPKKGLAIADILNAIGDTKNNSKTRRQIMLEKAYEMAEKGYLPAIEFIADRTEGKAPQTIKNISEQEIKFGEYKKELSTKTIDELIAEINRSLTAHKVNSK